MILTEHTPQGIKHRTLTKQEVYKLALEGHPQARKEIYNLEVDHIPENKRKVQLLAWALSITDDKPTPQTP